MGPNLGAMSIYNTKLFIFFSKKLGSSRALTTEDCSCIDFGLRNVGFEELDLKL